MSIKKIFLTFRSSVICLKMSNGNTFYDMAGITLSEYGYCRKYIERSINLLFLTIFYVTGTPANYIMRENMRISLKCKSTVSKRTITKTEMALET